MGDRRRPGGAATENAGAGTLASGDPAIPAARSGTSEAVPGGPGPRRSGRNAPAPPQEAGSPGPGNSMTRPCSDRQQNGEASNVSASNSPSRGSDRQQSGNSSSSSKKRKRISARSYFKMFKMAQGANAADVGVASDDKENTSSGHVADTNIYKLCEGTRLIGKNKRQSSDAVSKVSERLVSGSHETSETVVKHGSEPSSEAGPTLSPPLQQHDDTQQKEGVKKLMSTPKNLHLQLKQELSKLIKVLQLPDNVKFMAEQLFEYVLNNHQVVTEPVCILHAFNIALCWHAASLLKCKVDRRGSLVLAEKGLNCECNEELVALMYRKLRTLKEKIPYRASEINIKGRQETSTNLEIDHIFQNEEMDLHGEFSHGACQETSAVAEQIMSERQEPVQETRRECHMLNDEILSMIVEKSIDLVRNVFSLREKNILCKQQLEISGLVTHRQNNVIRLKEVRSLVLEHVCRSHIDEMTRREEIKLTAHWFTMLMYGFLDHMKFQHEKLEGLQSDTWSSERQLKENLYQVAKSGQLDQDFGQRIALPDSKFVMEEFIHFKEQDEPISIQPMENEPVETSVGSRGGLASEAVDIPENIISCNSDGIGVESAGCSSSTVSSNDDSIGQEASTCRNTDHIVKPSMLLGGATSLVRGVNSNNDDTMDTDGNHLDSPILASSQSFISMVGAQSVLPCMSPHQSTDLSAQQNLAPSRCPPVEAEHTGVGTQEIQVLQPEMQPSILFPDAPLQKISDDRSQTGFQPDRATGLPQGAVETSLHLGDARMQGQGISDGNVAVDPLLLTYPADSPVTLQVSTEVETQTCESTMPATQSTNPPAQQNVLGTEAASDLHPNVQPSTSMQDEPEEAEDEPDAVDEPAEAERAATLGVIAAQTLQPETQSSTSTQDVLFERTYLSGMPVLHSPTIHQSVEPSLHPHGEAESVGMVTAHDLQSKILPSAPVPAEQNTSLLSQQSLATSQHSPAEAEPADILCTKPACDLQPSVVEVHDQPAEEQSCILRTIAARNLQPETQPSTSMQSAPFGKTHLFVMSMLQNLMAHRTAEPSLDPHARAESTHTLGSLTAHVVQPEVQLSASMQGRPAEAEGAVMLGSTTAHDLQAEVQSSTKVQPVPLERIRPEESRQIGFLPNMVSGIEQPTHHPPVRTLVFNNPILSDDRLKIELHTLMHSNSLLSKDHEHKKALLLIECNQEIEKIKKKYASLLQKEESTYVQALRDLTDIYRKGLVEKSLAENFQGQITPPAAAQGSPVMEHAFESSSAAEEPSSIWNAQPQSILPGHLYGTTSSPLVLAPAPHGSEGSTGAQLHASAPLLQQQLPAASPSAAEPSSIPNVQPQSILPGHLYGTTSSPLVPAPAPNGSEGSTGPQLHASAPLLQHLRMPCAHAVHTDQQQLPAVSPPSGQYAPVIMGSYASTVPWGGAVLNCMDPSSAHQSVSPSA